MLGCGQGGWKEKAGLFYCIAELDGRKDLEGLVAMTDHEGNSTRLRIGGRV
jgi:hypothetical protein